MKTAAIVSFALFGISALGAPLSQAKRQDYASSNPSITATYSSTTTLAAYTTYTSTPSTTTTTYAGSRTILPEVQMQYNLNYPSTDVANNVTSAEVSSKPGSNNMTVAYNFPVTSEHVGKQCKFVFRVTSDNTGYVSAWPEESQIDVWHLHKPCINKMTRHSELEGAGERTLLGTIKPKIGAWVGDAPSPWSFTPYIDETDASGAYMHIQHGSAYSGFECQMGEYAIELVPHTTYTKVNWMTTLDNHNGLTIETF